MEPVTAVQKDRPLRVWTNRIPIWSIRRSARNKIWKIRNFPGMAATVTAWRCIMGRSDLAAGINKRRAQVLKEPLPEAAWCFMPQLSILKSLYAVNPSEPGMQRSIAILRFQPRFDRTPYRIDQPRPLSFYDKSLGTGRNFLFNLFE